MAFPTLPTLPGAISTGVATYFLALAIGADRTTMPSNTLKIFDGLLLRFEGLKNLNDVHCCASTNR